MSITQPKGPHVVQHEDGSKTHFLGEVHMGLNALAVRRLLDNAEKEQEHERHEQLSGRQAP